MWVLSFLYGKVFGYIFYFFNRYSAIQIFHFFFCPRQLKKSQKDTWFHEESEKWEATTQRKTFPPIQTASCEL